MPIYQTKNVSNSIKIGVWKITETKEELSKTLINSGFNKATLYQTKNKRPTQE